MDAVLDAQCRILVVRGYACVYQHVRGRGRSEGTWEPFVNDERDGQDLMAWIRAQSWSNGRIGWIGDSYLAATGWTVAAEDPDGLTTLVSRVFAPSLYGTAYEDGLLRHELVTAWAALMPDGRDDMLARGRYERALRHRPRATMDEVFAGHPVHWFRGWLAAEDPSDPLWSDGDGSRLDRAAEGLQIPILLVGGWSDAFIEAQVRAWGMLSTREQSVLVIGPWAHLGQVPADIPLRGIDGAGGGGGLAMQFPRVVDWYDTHLRDMTSQYPASGVYTYVVGGERWESRSDWPPPTRDTRLAAAPGAGRCDGALVAGADAPFASPLAYTYDPADPFPSRGGAGLLAGALPLMGGVPPGFVAAPDLCGAREDVLRFTSAPLDAPLHFAGTPRVELEVSSDAPDTAFGFRLLEQRPGGVEIVLREGFTTLALRDGPPRRPYTPGKRVRVTADSAPLEAELQPGSRVVLVITSSSYPAYEAHPNVGGALSEATEVHPAKQAVYGATLVLPEVRGDQ
jgi:putative CocE/NonD family hydrolase